MINLRLWHYKLIPYLPNKMLISQWRELIAIKRQWEKGTLKHRLVSYVMDYNKEYFYYYTYLVVEEMRERKIHYQHKYYDEIQEFCVNDEYCYPCPIYPEHGNRYLRQCYYNLQEKYDRGIITEEEWSKINDFEEDII